MVPRKTGCVFTTIGVLGAIQNTLGMVWEDCLVTWAFLCKEHFMVCAYRASYVVLASNGMSAHTDVMGQPEPMETPLSSQVEDISFATLPNGLAVGARTGWGGW